MRRSNRRGIGDEEQKMKSIRLTVISVLAVFGLALAVSPAFARGGSGGYHGGYGGGGGHGYYGGYGGGGHAYHAGYYGGGHGYYGGYYGGWYGWPYWAFGVGLAYPYWGSSYYYGYPYAGYPNVEVPPEAPPAYIERGGPPPGAAAPSQNSWYWCPSARGYFPYVKACPEGWQQVAPQ